MLNYTVLLVNSVGNTNITSTVIMEHSAAVLLLCYCYSVSTSVQYV